MATKVGFPNQIKYIVGNEACERFSFYGMRCILVVFMVQHLFKGMPQNVAEADAKAVFHTFVSACYFLPLLGAFLSDRFLGKYKTILYLSVIYCLGHGVLAMFDSTWGLFAGLTLIAIGTGGIKPCVSAHVGDQFDQSNSHLLPKVYEMFYFSINFGSFFSTLLIPVILVKYGPSWAFGIPGVLMVMATYVFWLGRKQYVHVPPSGKEGGSQFFSIVWYALLHLGQKQKGKSFLEVARGKYSDERVEGAVATVDVFKVLASVSVFWSLFDQHASTWVIQAQQMNREFLGFQLEASQIQSLNPIIVMILIPIFSLGLYPLVARMGIKVTPLRKMSTGMVLAGFSFILVGAIQLALDKGAQISVGWQIFPFIVLTASEVMVSITGLEFAYTQAPRAMKSTIMSLWLLTVTVGNWITAVISLINRFQGAAEFFFYATLMFVVSAIFIWGAMRYKDRNYIEPKGAF